MRINKDHFLLNIPIAHRGLHNADAGIPENSYAAFEAAISAGYAIETDVRFSKDGKIVLFHDDDLLRMTGHRGKVIDKTFKELSALSLGNTGERIPLLSEFLAYTDGKAPLLIEIKNQPERGDLVKETISILKNYRGEYALQSFNPLYLAKIKKYSPETLRGQLGCFYNKFTPQRFIVKNMNLNFLTKPDFISYCIDDLPYEKARKKDTALLGWTVRTQAEFSRVKELVDNIIFENIRPQIPTKQ